jgi:carbamoyltransferase
MKFLTTHIDHDSSTCLLQNGLVKLHIPEERLSRIKRDDYPLLSIQKAVELFGFNTDDTFLASSVSCNHSNLHDSTTWFRKAIKQSDVEIENKINSSVFLDNQNHHLYHASTGFFNSGFEEAIVIVADGGGALVDHGSSAKDHHDFDMQEIYSVYHCSYPDKIERIKTVVFKDDISAGILFEVAAVKLGFTRWDAGKVMGLAPYGNPVDIKIVRNSEGIPYDIICDGTDEDLACGVQNYVQNKILGLMQESLETIQSRNIVMTGGVGLNCVANYWYLDNLPKDVNLYCEPMSTDDGISVGSAQLLYRNKTKDTTIRPLKTLYLGAKYDIEIYDGERCTTEDVAELLSDGKIVAMYQGRAESGPRSLGNRTILFDPRIPNGKQIVNSVKKREEFRPFAGTIMHEHFSEWFETRGIDESPFMMYAMNVVEEKRNLIPSIVHVDGTCRIQTLKKEQNLNFYELLDSFYQKTGVPVLFNTSFNLAGEPIVETPEDAMSTFERSEIDCLYFPEMGIIINKNIR